MVPFGSVRTRMCNVGLDEETPTQVEFCITVTRVTKVPVRKYSNTESKEIKEKAKARTHSRIRSTKDQYNSAIEQQLRYEFLQM